MPESLVIDLARRASVVLASALFFAVGGAVADEPVTTTSSTPSHDKGVANAISFSSVLARARLLSPGAGISPTEVASSAESPSSIDPPAHPAKSFFAGVASRASDVVSTALNLIGVRYIYGGNTPKSGLDCSGFVRYVFQDTLGLTLPRRAEEMSRVGEKIRIDELKPGDLVFFNTMRRAFSHVGIYIGGNKFVHSPSTGSTIRVDEIDRGYWEKRFTGARRIDAVYLPDQNDEGADSGIRRTGYAY